LIIFLFIPQSIYDDMILLLPLLNHNLDTFHLYMELLKCVLFYSYILGRYNNQLVLNLRYFYLFLSKLDLYGTMHML